MVSIKFSKAVSAAKTAHAAQSVPTAAALLAFALFFISIFAFAGCTARAALSLDADKGAALSFKTEAGKSLEQTVTAFTGTEENKTLFDDAKIKAGFKKAGFTLDSLSLSGKTGISLNAHSADIRTADTGGALSIRSNEGGETLTVKLSPATLNSLLKLMPAETAEYTEFLMAPAFTGEKMSAKEYADSIGSMYGSTMRKESESSFFIFDVSAPGEITEAAVLPAGTGSASKNGKKASFRIALNTFLSNSGEITIRVRWKK